MSDTVNGSVGSFCHSQDRPGRVPIPAHIEAAGASECTFVQRHALGSREAPAARHGRVGGLNHHHRSASPLGVLDQGSLQSPYRGVRGFSSHPRLREEQRTKVFNSDEFMIRDNPSCPKPTGVQIAPGGRHGYLRSLPLCASVPNRNFLTARPTSSIHLSLSMCKFARNNSTVLGWLQVVIGVGRRRSGGDSPVNPYRTRRVRRRRHLASRNEGRVPVTQSIPVDADGRWVRGQLSGPHDWHGNSFRQPETTISNRESSGGVFEAGRRSTRGLEAWPLAPLDRERLGESHCESPEHLLLGDLGSFSEPLVLGPRRGEALREHGVSRLSTASQQFNRLIPHISAPMPFSDECFDRGRARAQPIGVTHRLLHAQHHRPGVPT